MQFGHAPEQQSRPRGRWYLKLREKTRRPEAKSADPIVSPSNASTGWPSKVNVKLVFRSSSSPGCAASLIQPACQEWAWGWARRAAPP
jgi:hypothetical protein